jgi:hypothetical protein
MKFLSMFGGISDKYKKKNGNRVFKFMICGQQGLIFISANLFSLYWIQQILIWKYCLQLTIRGQK